MKPIFILKDNEIIEQFDSIKKLNDYLHKINRHLDETETVYFSYDFLYENPDYFINHCTNEQLLKEIEGRMIDIWHEEGDNNE